MCAVARLLESRVRLVYRDVVFRVSLHLPFESDHPPTAGPLDGRRPELTHSPFYYLHTESRLNRYRGQGADTYERDAKEKD